MAQINEWLSIDKANGSGDATITLTASSSTELNDRIASLEIRGITKSVYMNVRQRAYVEPDTNAYFWVKLESDGEISGIKINTIEYSFNQTNWSSFTANGSISVPANTYVWFRNTSNIFNHATYNDASSFLFSVKGSVGGDLSSLGSMMEHNFCHLFANGLSSWNTKLVDASQLILPWDVLAEYCYHRMFHKCNVLTSAPELPATELAEYCYFSMFYECVALLTAPSLPATTLAESCYGCMFQGCRKLTTAPSLPATTLAESCYVQMFCECTSLIETPYLPATLIPNDAYKSMFRGCTSLTTISRIETPDFSNASGMFWDCTSLTEWVVEEWVVNMDADGIFQGCTKLKKITAKPTIAPSIEPYTLYGTFYGIAENGVLYIPIGSDYSAWLSTERYYLGYYGWTAEPDPEQPNNDYFWIKLEENGDIQGLKVGTFQHSYDRINWYYSPATLSVPANTYVWFRNTYPPILNAENETKIHFTKRGSIGGNISSIGDMRERNFIRLFYGNENLVDASELILPWNTLAESCYELMFDGCTSLVNAPVLPATTLASDCYNWMFYGCTSLTTAPELPATTLAKSCYLAMFRGCTSLTTAPTLPATTLAEYCYFEMFDKCTSLTTAPTLPATTLVEWCYAEMFFKCENLTMVECHAEDISADFCLDSWLYRVSPTGTFIKKQGVTYPIGDSGIPTGWAIQNIT